MWPPLCPKAYSLSKPAIINHIFSPQMISHCKRVAKVATGKKDGSSATNESRTGKETLSRVLWKCLRGRAIDQRRGTAICSTGIIAVMCAGPTDPPQPWEPGSVCLRAMTLCARSLPPPPKPQEDRGKMDGREGHLGSEKQLQSIYEKGKKKHWADSCLRRHSLWREKIVPRFVLTAARVNRRGKKRKNRTTYKGWRGRGCCCFSVLFPLY